MGRGKDHANQTLARDERTLILCPDCAQRIAEKSLRIRFLDLERGTRGMVRFVNRAEEVIAETEQVAV